MAYMFGFATAFNKNISMWNVGKVTKMSWMFYNATAFNQDLSGWDVRAVTNMYKMFDWCNCF